MISGSVRGLTPAIPLTIEDQNGELRQYRVVLDSGFTDYLSMPPDDIKRLGLVPDREAQVTLADGTRVACKTYNAVVYWHDRRLEVRVLELGVQPLLGMRLLNGSRVGMDVAEGGPVSVEPL